jgi:putative ABC transport system permease protein
MVMVALGMIGVFWQSVTRRIDEIGLRRAVGSPRGTVYGQLLGEIIALTLLGSCLAAVVVIQLPLLGIFGRLDTGLVLSAMGVTVLMLCALSTLAGLYPAFLAARLEPARALRDE